MDLPYLSQRVRIDGHPSAYFVVAVDQDSQTVDLIPASGHGRVLNGVPFSALLPPGSTPAKTNP